MDRVAHLFDSSGNVWADSDIRTYLNGTFLTSNFSTAEQSAITESTKSAADSSDGDGRSNLSYASLSGDKIFFLDAKEATNTSYGYSNTDLSATNREKTGDNAYWWLRSADTAYSSSSAGYVYSDGDIGFSYVNYDSVGVSPALNINLSSVLFSSVISGTAGETGAKYKLTLIDNDMKISVNGTVTRKGDIITIPYTVSGANGANVSQVSVLILDKEYTAGNTNNANVLAYGAVDSTGEFTIPTELSNKVCGSDYYAYVVAEDVNGIYETDYASTPVKIIFKEEVVETPETEEPTTVIDETIAEKSTTEESTSEESTTEESTSEQEEENTTSISGETSTEEEISSTTVASTNTDNGNDKGDSDKVGKGWLIWLILGIVILFILVFLLLFIFKRKKDKDEQEVTEENKDI